MQEIGKFVIKEPCHEDWEKMTPQQQGRFCEVCAKCVVDLTQKTPEEILTAYKENEVDMCGRMTVSQLRSTANQPSIKPLKTGRWPIAAATLKRIQIFAAAFVALFVLAFNGKARAQELRMKGKISYVKEEGHLEGTVRYDHGGLAGGLMVQLKKGNQLIVETLTDDQGRYLFTDLRPGQYLISVSAYSWDMVTEKVQIVRRITKTLNLTVFDEAIDGDMEMIPIDIEPELEPVSMDTIPEVAPEIIKVGEIAYLPPVEEIEVPATPTHSEVEPLIETEPETPQALEVPGPAPEIDLTIFPNPTQGIFSAQVKAEKHSRIDMMITDLKGQVLISRTIGKQAIGHFTVDLSEFANGTYILHIQMGDALQERRIIKAE